MTAAPERRRRATRLALVATALVLVVVGGAGLVGAHALYRSTDGRDAGNPARETVPMPDTPNALLGVTSSEGRLTALAVITLLPREADGSAREPGGSIVPLPVTAAVGGEAGASSLAERFDGDAEALGQMVGSLLGVTFDRTAVVGEAALADLLDPVTEAPVALPADVVAGDHSAPQVLFEAGEQEITGAGAAEILATQASGDDGLADVTATRNAAAVWSAVAAERTAVAEASDSETSSDTTQPDTSAADEGGGDEPGELMSALLAGPVESRELHSTPVDAADRSLVELDPVDALLVFGQLSPRNVVETSPSFSVRVVSPFADDDLAEGTSADAAYGAIELLVAEQVNVVSVSTTPGDVPAATHIDVVNPDAADYAEIMGDDLFGDHTMGESNMNLAGVDLVVTLGEGFVA